MKRILPPVLTLGLLAAASCHGPGDPDATGVANTGTEVAKGGTEAPQSGTTAQTSVLWKAQFELADPPLRNLPVIAPAGGPDEKGIQEVEVRNVGDTTLLYWGYGPDQPQAFQEIGGDEGWEIAGWNWCGTGLREYAIPPGGAVTFRVSITGTERVRVLTGFSEKDTDRRSYVVLATRPRSH